MKIKMIAATLILTFGSSVAFATDKTNSDKGRDHGNKPPVSAPVNGSSTAPQSFTSGSEGQDASSKRKERLWIALGAIAIGAGATYLVFQDRWVGVKKEF